MGFEPRNLHSHAVQICYPCMVKEDSGWEISNFLAWHARPFFQGKKDKTRLDLFFLPFLIFSHM